MTEREELELLELEEKARLEAAPTQSISPVTGKPYTPEQLGWGTGYAPNLQAEDVGLEIAKAIGVEKAYLGDTSFFGGAPVVMSPQDKQALLTLVNMPPEKREEAASAFLSVYNPGGGERGQYTLARATKRAEDDFLKRAQALGFSPDNLPKDPGIYKTALGSLGQAVTLGSMDYLLSKMAPSLADVKEAVKTGQPSFGVEFSDVLTRLKDYNPALYARIEQGDNTLTEEEYRQGVQDAVNTEARAGALRSPGASLLGETAGIATGEGLAAKTFGKAFTTPLVQATKEGVRGYNLGETPMQSLGGAVLGAGGGAVGAKIGQKGGTKIGGPQLKDARDVLARQAAQAEVDKALAPALAEARAEYAAAQAKAANAVTYAEKKAAQDLLAQREQKMQGLLASIIKKQREAYEKSAGGKGVKDYFQEMRAADALKQQEIEKARTPAERAFLREAEKAVSAEQAAKFAAFEEGRAAEAKLRAEALKLAEDDLGVTEAKGLAKKARADAFKAGKGLAMPVTAQEAAFDRLSTKANTLLSRLEDLDATIGGKTARYYQTEQQAALLGRDGALKRLQSDVASNKITQLEADVRIAELDATYERAIDNLLEQTEEQVQAAAAGTTRPAARATSEVAKQKAALQQQLADTQNQIQKLYSNTGNTQNVLPKLDKTKFDDYLKNEYANLQTAGLNVPDWNTISQRADELLSSGELFERKPKLYAERQKVEAMRAMPEPALLSKEELTQRAREYMGANYEELARRQPKVAQTLESVSREPRKLPGQILKEAKEKAAATESKVPPEWARALSGTPQEEELMSLARQQFETGKGRYLAENPELSALLRETPEAASAKARADLLAKKPELGGTPFVPPKEKELAAMLPQGVTVPQADKLYGRAGTQVGPVSVSFGEAKPPLSSKEISPYAKYARAAVKRSAAEEAMQTPVAVPALQAALTTVGRDVAEPLFGRQSDIATLISKLLPEETEQAEQTFDEAKQKLKTYYDALRK